MDTVKRAYSSALLTPSLNNGTVTFAIFFFNFNVMVFTRVLTVLISPYMSNLYFLILLQEIAVQASEYTVFINVDQLHNSVYEITHAYNQS